MKKFSLLLTLAIMMVGSTVFAGSIDYLSNQSAKYIMNTASQARTDGADIVSYNPAGTALMGEGFFLDVSSQTLLKYYEESVDGGDTYKQSEPTLCLPNIYGVYNFGQMGPGKLAAFANAGIPAGGGSLVWDDGTVGSEMAGQAIGAYLGSVNAALATTTTDVNLKVEGSSVYYAIGAGAAYSFLEDMFSASLSAKYVMAKRTGKMSGSADYNTAALGMVGASTDWTMEIDTEYSYDASGITPVIGFDAKPVKELTIGVRYEFETALEFEYDQDSNDVSHDANFGALAPGADALIDGGVAGMLDKDGIKANRNLPAILSFGAEYAVMPELSVSAGTNIYFVGDADMEGYEDNFGTGYEISLGAIYKVMEPLKVGGTFLYTSQAAKSDLIDSTDLASVLDYSGNPVLDSMMFGLGATYTVIPNLDATLSFAWTHYLPEESESNVTYEKNIYMIALGVGYKM